MRNNKKSSKIQRGYSCSKCSNNILDLTVITAKMQLLVFDFCYFSIYSKWFLKMFRKQ